jgi:hypothetical protein
LRHRHLAKAVGTSYSLLPKRHRVFSRLYPSGHLAVQLLDQLLCRWFEAAAVTVSALDPIVCKAATR